MPRNRVKSILNNPLPLAHMAGFKKLTPLNGDWIKHMLTETKDMTLLAHRESYKTTCVSFVIACLVILRPRLTILFMRKTDNDVTEIIRQVKRILQSDHFKYLSSSIYGVQVELTEENSSAITTNYFLSANPGRGSSQLVGMGIKGSLTGKHFDIIITDDIVNVKDRISKAEREYTKLIVSELHNVLNRGGRFINCGTPWHKDDAISFMPNVRKYDCYTTGIMTDEQIKNARQNMSSAMFSANYELKHIADKDLMFIDAKFTETKPINGLAHIDAAYGGADFTALTIAKLDGKNIIVFGKLFDTHVDTCSNEIYKLCGKYKAGTIYCEDNADKGYLKKQIKQDGYLARGYHEKMNKHYKISTHLKGNWSNVYFTNDSDPNYINNVLEYSELVDHDDAPDSLASIVRILTTGSGLIIM